MVIAIKAHFQDTSVLFPIAPLLAVIIPHLMIYYKSTSGVFDDNIVLFCITYGFVSSKITNRLVVGFMLFFLF